MARIKGVLYDRNLFSKGLKSIADDKLKSPSIETIISTAEEKGINTKPFDIKMFIQECGISIIYEDLGDFSGYILPMLSGWVISVHQYDSNERQRFTLAHELMHYLYHKDIIEKQGDRYNERITFRDPKEEKVDTNKIEMQANLLAGELLMAEAEFRDEYCRNKGNLEDVGAIFEVSKSAAWVRARQLELIVG